MAAMRRGLVHVLAWSLATGAAVTLSWWGVHTVMAGTAYDPPRALPLTAGDTATQESEPRSSATSRPAPSGSPSKSASPTPSRPPRSPSPSGSAPATSAPPSPSGQVTSGQVKSYDTDGGRVVFDLGKTSATLVSATPGAGWSMQVWKTETWIRVEFASGADRVSVFCTWHDGPPRVEVGTY
jgi:cytoskeletal protein RodZ